MAIAKRIFLFLLVNICVVVTISLILSLFNIKPFLASHGMSMTQLIIFCFVWGMGGAFISLGLSRIMAKWLMGVRLIDPNTRDPEERKLLETVHHLAREAGLPKMPQVGIYNSPEVNAFATGPTRSRSLVAVSSGLLNKMEEKAVEGVLGHEIAHVANGDMVTLTLIQGVVNAFVMFLARILAFALSGLGKSRDSDTPPSYATYMILVFVFEIIFMILGSMIVAYFSRVREFKADKGGAEYAGKEKMLAALNSLLKLQKIRDPKAEQPSLEPMKISATGKANYLLLFATHPPLEKRIERLQSS